MANNSTNSNASWGGPSQGADDSGLQVRPMGLKIHYTFDKDSQERCLARWPQILQVQTIPIDEHTSIGVTDLRTCLQAVVQCSPELAGDSEKDYTVYAFDYSEPDTPLVGQGMLSWGLSQAPGSPDVQSQLVTGRVTKNLLAIFGNGIRETLEVRLKLTAVPKIARNYPASRPQSSARHTPTLSTSTSALMETNEWHSLIRASPGLGHAAQVSTVNSPIMPEPIRPFGSGYGTRNDMAPHFQGTLQGTPIAPGSRPPSVDSTSRERHDTTRAQAPPNVPLRPSPSVDETPQIQTAAKASKPQSRPSSRASSHVPTGRPRGRPRKTTLVAEGSTSGYEDGTDGDDQPPRKKKRAKTTKVEQRNNTATFNSAPESLRVAASTAGSIRNFRPIAASGETPGGNHLQEVPRAPTPIPDSRLSGLPYIKASGTSNLRRQSITSHSADGSFASHSDLNRSLSQSQDARSPLDSVASPSQTYSDEASPADIGSSPPVPRSAMYSVRSSPAPSSPILPPMPVPATQPDSGFMSGGLDDSRVDDDNVNRAAMRPATQTSAVPKPKPRRGCAKKQETKTQPDLHIHAETPGPPELLPQTSIYNPPVPLARRNSERAKTPATTDNMRSIPNAAASDVTVTEPIKPVATMVQQEQRVEDKAPSPEEESTRSFTGFFDTSLMSDAGDDHQRYLESLGLGDHSFTPADEGTPPGDIQPTIESNTCDVRACVQSTSMEPELPIIPASDPVLPQLTLPMPLSEPAHPQTDIVDIPEEKSNKNYIKRQTIKQKLEEAVAQGQMPSFCQNCGALQTPTWRKIWKQEHKGVPEYHEYSEKPGHVTAIKILGRDEDGKPTAYEIIKKSLGPTDNKSAWTEVLLCNPCGIWFSKWKAHRPPEKWEKDEQRLTQTRKKRANGNGPSRSKKSRTKSDGQTNPTSEACPPTDALTQHDGSLSPKESSLHTLHHGQRADNVSEKGSGKGRKRTTEAKDRGSTHSRGTGTPGSPIMLEEELGGTRRLLFPSPRKDGEQRILGEVAVNIVQTSEINGSKAEEHDAEKENCEPASHSQIVNNDFADLFGTPPRPSTPPPKVASSGPFKTPTRPTPSHRPITRSVTKSKRSSGRSTNSPRQLDPNRTPTRTPRSALRRSPRHLLAAHLLEDQGPETPMTKSVYQLLSDAENFVMPSPGRAFQLDLNSLSQLDSDDHLVGGAQFDFSHLIGTDMMPSSPPMLRDGHMTSFGASLTYDDAHIWAHFHAGNGEGGSEGHGIAIEESHEESR